MKDQYVGDVNDFLKYSLLRGLVQNDGLAVVWMLTSSDLSSDGRRLKYLDQPTLFRRVDPELYDALRQIVRSERREVGAVESASVLPPTTRFVSPILADDVTGRAAYFEQVWRQVSDRPFVFFDPDNGLETASTPKGRRRSSKYLYWDELARAYALGRSLIIYQHFNREPRGVFLPRLAARIHELTGCHEVFGVSTPHVAFLAIPQRELSEQTRLRLTNFCARATPFATVGALLGAQRPA
jgi:hypothetical protein